MMDGKVWGIMKAVKATSRDRPQYPSTVSVRPEAQLEQSPGSYVHCSQVIVRNHYRTPGLVLQHG